MTTYKYYWKTVLLFLLLNSNYSFGQIVETFSTPGSFTWTCPANVSQITVECWGGGGGGGNSGNSTVNGGHGGGGGAYSKSTVSVIPGNIYYLYVGNGGIGGPANSTASAQNGEDSWFNDVNGVPVTNGWVLANGGKKGINNTNTNLVNKGEATLGIGTTKYSGGNGLGGTSAYGQGGGSSAGYDSDGTNASAISGAIAPNGGGNGGTGSSTTTTHGQSGFAPGGGGGGSDDSPSRKGGNGGNGLIQLSYYINCSGTPNSALINISSPNGCEGLSTTITATNLSTEPGINIQWQISNGNNIWTDISGETSSSYISTPSSTCYFRLKSMCSFSGLESFSQEVDYTVFPVPSIPELSNSGDTTFCQGDSIILSSNFDSELTYQWRNNNVDLANQTNNSYVANSNGEYSLLVTNIYGCTANSLSSNVIVNPVPNALVSVSGPTIFCQGSNVVLSVNPDLNQTYQWLNNGTNINGATSNSFTATSSGTYSITMNNTYGCISISNPIIVTVSSYPVSTIDNQGISLICQGGIVLLSANTGTGLTYQWVNNGTNISGANTSSYSASSAGTYTVIVTNAGLCSTTSSPLVLTTLNQITTTLYPTNSTMNTGFVTSTGSKTSGNMSVSTSTTYGRGWAKFPLSSIPSGSVITGVTIKFYTYGGTSSTSSNTIRGFTGDPVTMTASSIYIAIGSGTAYNTSTWTIGTSTTPSLNTKVLSSAGITYVQNQLATGYVNFGFVGGSTNLQSIYGYSNSTYGVRMEITYTPAAPTAIISSTGNTTFCQGNSILLNANIGSGLTYQWKNNGTNISGTSSSYTAASSGNYTVQVTNSSGCSAISNPKSITVNPIPLATISNNGSLTICQGESVELYANFELGLTYQWKKNGVIITGVTTPSYLANTSGLYNVVITNVNGCSATSNSMNVTVNPLPISTITLSGPTTFCQGNSISLSNNSGVSYQWSNNNENMIGEINSSFIANSSGFYSVFITNSNGCSINSAPIGITVNPLPISTITTNQDTIFCEGGSTVLLVDNQLPLNYQWFKNGILLNGQTNSILQTSNSGIYNVKLTDQNGCENLSFNSIQVIANPNPYIQISGDTSICIGETTLLTAASNGNVTWNGNLNQNTFEVQPNITCTYIVSAINSNNCLSTQQVIVEVNFPKDTTIYTSSYGPYVLNGTIYSESGIYNQSLFTTEGCDSTITLNLNYITNSIEELNKFGFIIYPNPSSNGIFNLRNENSILSFQYRVFNEVGVILLEDKNYEVIDLTNFSNGIYWIQIISEKGSCLGMLVKD